MAKNLHSAKKERYFSIPSVEKKEFYSLAPAQKRIYILTQIRESGTSFNLPGAFSIEGELDKNRLETVFCDLVKRHEALRSYIEIVADEPRQIVLNKMDFRVEVREISCADEGGKKEQVEKSIKQFIRPFDLGTPALFRVKLIEERVDCFVMVYDLHHIIADETSMELLVDEFVHLYNGDTLPAIRIQYKEFAVWHEYFFKSESMKKQEEYWLEQFSGQIPVLKLPFDFSHVKNNQIGEGVTKPFYPLEELTLKVEELILEAGTTLNIFLLTVYYLLLASYSGQEDIVVGSPIEGRRHNDLRKIIGMFVNMVVLRNFPKGEKRFGDFLEEVKESLLCAYENQDFQFDDLVKKMGLQREKNKHPLFDAAFTVHNWRDRLDDIRVGGKKLAISPFEFKHDISKFDLHLIIYENEEGFNYAFEYFPSLFKVSTIQKMAERFEAILRQVVDDQEIKIRDIEITEDAFSAAVKISEDDLSDFNF